MRFATVDKVEATEQFARDTDDPVAALATFRQVLDESLLKATEGFLVGVTAPWQGVRLMADAVAGLETLCRGLAALVERCMEPWDEDTWEDFLRDGAEDGWIAGDHTAERHEGVERATGRPCQHPRCLADEDYDSTPPTNGGCYDEPEPTVCPYHGDLNDDGGVGRCWACWYADLAVDAELEHRAFGE